MKTDKKVYEFMLAYQFNYFKSPKMDEIREAVDGLNYRSSVRQSLVRLEKKGLVEHEAPNKMRCWKATE